MKKLLLSLLIFCACNSATDTDTDELTLPATYTGIWYWHTTSDQQLPCEVIVTRLDDSIAISVRKTSIDGRAPRYRGGNKISDDVYSMPMVGSPGTSDIPCGGTLRLTNNRSTITWIFENDTITVNR